MRTAALLPDAGEPWRLSFLREAPEDDPDILLGPPFDTRVEVQDFQIYLELRGESPVVKFAMEIEGLALVLTNRWFRTWGESFDELPNGIRYDADLTWSVVESEGFRLNFSSALDVKLQINWRIGPQNGANILLHSLRFTVPIDATQDDIRGRLEIRAHVSIQLGPCLLVVVDGFGAWFGWWKDDLADAAEDYSHVGLLPPSGAGIEITAGPVKAGGFIRYEELPGGGERYSGALSCLINGIGAIAFGIYERDDDGNKSAIFVIGIRFGIPGIQLGFGLALSGIGGVIGTDRRMDVDALRERLTSGGAGNVLFLDDPICNAPVILDDIAAIFPARQGVMVVGPTLQITWISGVVSIDAGVVFEVSDGALSKIVILGSVRAPAGFNFGSLSNPEDQANPIFNMRLDIVGVIDFAKGLVEFDGTLINSHAFRNFSLTGDGAFRAKFGSGGYVLLSLGSFHPDSPPPPLPELTRIAVTTHPGFFSVGYHFRAEAYMAFTPNTFQFGGAIEVGFAAGPLNILGILGADVLIQFVPFAFDIRIFFVARIRWNDKTIAGVRVEGSLSGPGPTKLRGRGCIEILFFDICKSGEIRIGNDPAPPVAMVASLVQALSAELDESSNLEAAPPGRSEVALMPPEEGLSTGCGFRPTAGSRGGRSAPLELELDRFEGARLAVPQALVVESSAAVGQVRDEFSSGSFLDLTESEQLNLPSFESNVSGVSLAFGMNESAQIQRAVEIVNFTLPRPVPFIIALVALPIGVLMGARSRTALAEPALGRVQVAVAPETFAVMGASGAVAASGLTAHDAHRRAQRQGTAAVPAVEVFDMGMF